MDIQVDMDDNYIEPSGDTQAVLPTRVDSCTRIAQSTAISL